MKKWIAGLGSFMGAMGVAVAAFAAEGGTGGGDWAIFGVMLGMGLASAGGALGQGRAVAAALEGIARNPGAASKVQTPMILGLALIESLVLFSLLIAFILMGKI